MSLHGRFKVYTDPYVGSDIKTNLRGAISDWSLYGYYCPYIPEFYNPTEAEKEVQLAQGPTWWWHNSKTNEERKYMGKDVPPEDCPLIERKS